MGTPIPLIARAAFPRLPDRLVYLESMVRVGGHRVFVIVGGARSREPVREPRVVGVPSLNDLAANPTLADTLPRAVVVALYGDAAKVEALLRARLFTSVDASGGAPAALVDVAVGLEEAAHVLGMRPSTLYRKWRALGIGYKDTDGHVKFTQAALHRYIARKGG